MEKIREAVEQALNQQEQEQEIQRLTEQVNYLTAKVDNIENSYVTKASFLFVSILFSVLISFAVSLFLFGDSFLDIDKRLNKLETLNAEDE